VRLHHIGIVVQSIAAAAPGFAQSLQAVWDRRIIHDPLQAARVSFLSVGDGQPMIELVEAAGEDSPVTRAAMRGGGLHHLCYEVPDLARQLETCRRSGDVLVRSPQPAIAFENRRICWVFTRERLLLEYLEATAAAVSSA
jgi:methylmalonyl-CoA/ethylmalonyl-CoA epimerase